MYFDVEIVSPGVPLVKPVLQFDAVMVFVEALPARDGVLLHYDMAIAAGETEVPVHRLVHFSAS